MGGACPQTYEGVGFSDWLTCTALHPPALSVTCEQVVVAQGYAMPNEADTCRRFVVPKLQQAGWDEEPHRINEQVTFTDGRIVVAGQKWHRRPGKRADYILRYQPDLPIAVVEAKPTYATLAYGLQQAKVDRLKDLQAKTAAELDALLPSILDKAFKGEL